MSELKKRVSYIYLICLFFKVGSQAFGGWSTTVLLLEKELVNRRKLLSSDDIHGSTTYAQIIPGGTQTSIVSGIGYRLKGINGSIAATFFYLLPSLLMITLFSVIYFHYLRGSELTNHLNLIRSALGGIILANAYRIGKHHASSSLLWLFVVAAFVVRLLGVNSIFIILIYAFIGLALSIGQANGKRHDS